MVSPRSPLTTLLLPGEDYDLERMLERAHDLHDRIHEILNEGPFYDSPRSQATIGLCMVALEHANGLQALMALALPTSAVSLMRHQFEALTRAMWVFYAAPDLAVDKLMAPLTLESEKAAKNLPGAKDMIDALGANVGAPGQGVPASAYQMLAHFKEGERPAVPS